MLKIKQNEMDSEMVDLFDDTKNTNLWTVFHNDMLTDDSFFGVRVNGSESIRERIAAGETIALEIREKQ